MKTNSTIRITGILIFFAMGFFICFPAFGKTEVASSLPIRRFAIIVGSNDGGKERVRLQYAASDAGSFSRVMETMGGLNKNDSIILKDPGYKEFSQGMNKMKQMLEGVNTNRERREFVLYYSGHSDEEGLLLGQTRYSYKKLRSDIINLPAEVHIAILDSCSSGALTRSKGGVRRPAFLLDAANVMEGHAFLTSSSADEAAQESDLIKGSFFTHYLVSGLRGAADATGDGKVTLNEAYHYAFNETLASTERTRFGAQHPTYDISLTGTGDIVLTDLREISAGLAVSGDISGRIFIRDYQGSLIVELNKLHDNQIDLGLEPGLYDVTLKNTGGKYQANIAVEKGRKALLSRSDLIPIEEEPTVSRGDDDSYQDSPLQQRVPESNEEEYVRQPVHFGFLPAVSSSEDMPKTVNNVSINVLWGESNRIEGFEAGVIGNVVRDDMVGFQAAGVTNVVDGNVYGAHVAGFYNYVGNDMRYTQITAGVNIVKNNMYGVQIGIVHNRTGKIMHGVQIGGLYNYNQGTTYGVQVCGIANYTKGHTTGVQFGGITNIARGPVNGVQFAGITNQSDQIIGAQISLVNITGDVRGAQVGAINIAGNVTGSQVGLVNISKDIQGEAVGLITVTGDGQRHFEIWGDSSGFSHFGFRLGTAHVYTLYTLAFNPFTEPARWSYGIGLGGELPLNNFFINADATLHDHHKGFDRWYDSGRPNFVPDLRVMGGYKLDRLGGLYAGGSVMFFIPGWYSTESMSDYSRQIQWGSGLSLKLTFFAGIRI